MLLDTQQLRDDGNHGITYARRQNIKIDADLPVGRQRVTALHEIIHAIVSELLPVQNELTEPQSYALAAGLFQVLADNPPLMAWLFPQGMP